jgi:hypothetical protein
MSFRRSRPAYGYSTYRTGAPAPAVDKRTPRAAWLAMLDYVVAAVDAPAQQPLDLMNSLRGVTAASFPADPRDSLSAWGKSVLDRIRLWCDAGEARRTAFAPGLRADVVALKEILIDQGAAEAAASRQRMGFRED